MRGSSGLNLVEIMRRQTYYYINLVVLLFWASNVEAQEDQHQEEVILSTI